MSFRAELTIADTTYRVLNCSHTLARDYDITGRPSSRTRFGRIELEIESTEDIMLWTKIGVFDGESLSGQVLFKRRDEEAKMKILHFSGGFVVEHTERFISVGETPMTIRVVISAHLLRMESNTAECEITNEWPI